MLFRTTQSAPRKAPHTRKATQTVTSPFARSIRCAIYSRAVVAEPQAAAPTERPRPSSTSQALAAA